MKTSKRRFLARLRKRNNKRYEMIKNWIRKFDIIGAVVVLISAAFYFYALATQ